MAGVMDDFEKRVLPPCLLIFSISILLFLFKFGEFIYDDPVPDSTREFLCDLIKPSAVDSLPDL